MKKILKTTLLAVAIAATTVHAQEAKTKFVTIGTGGQTGVYYAVGQAVCRLVNRDTDKNNIKCNAPSTSGSMANINSISAGEMNVGVLQSDIQYNAYNGTGNFEGKKIDKIRALFSIHPEPFTMVARKDANINKFEDIKGKRVNVGDPGAGNRVTMEIVMGVKGIKMSDLALKSELKPAEMAAALCDNNIDAMVYVVGHPSGAIKEATTSCDSVLVDVTGPEVDKLVADHKYYAKVTIPKGMYKGTDHDVNTFGMYATLVSSTDTDVDTAYEIVKAVFDNFDQFKKLHPAFANLKPEDMIKNAISAPLHEGAIKYYKERGWMK